MQEYGPAKTRSLAYFTLCWINFLLKQVPLIRTLSHHLLPKTRRILIKVLLTARCIWISRTSYSNNKTFIESLEFTDFISNLQNFYWKPDASNIRKIFPNSLARTLRCHSIEKKRQICDSKWHFDIIYIKLFYPV